MNDTELARLGTLLRQAHGGPGLVAFGAVTDLEQAYRLQAHNVCAWEAEGRRRSGYKIGMTSLAAQRLFGVEEPDYGVLFADMALADGATIAAGRLSEPRIEGEIALELGADIQEPMSPEALADCICAMAPAIEIADSRIAGWKITIHDTVCDNASAGLYTIGAMRRFDLSADLSQVQMELRCGSETISSGTGAATMGGPLQALASRGGMLRKGDVIMTGALGPPVAPQSGQRYEACLSGLGSVALGFA